MPWKTIAGALGIGFAIVDLYPRFGPPDFRYTGSDPARPVWNLGVPTALWIYDPQLGFQAGPAPILFLAPQFLVLAVIIVMAILQSRHTRADTDGSEPNRSKNLSTP